MKRTLLIAVVMVPLLALVAVVGLRAVDTAGYLVGETIGSAVYIKGFGANFTKVGANATTYTPDTNETLVEITTTGAVTMGLPPASTCQGKIYMIGKGTVSGTGAITIDPYGSEKIDGGTTYASIDATGDGVVIMSTGTEWIIVGKQID